MLLIIVVLMIFYDEYKGNGTISSSIAELTKLAFFILPFIFFNLISLTYTWSLYNSLIEINYMAWMIGGIFIFCCNKKKEILLKALITAMVLIVFIMVFQFLILFPNLKQIFTEGKEAFFLSKKNVPFVSFLNESTLAGYFLFIIPLSLYYGIIKKNIFFKATSVIIIFGLLFTISRMGIFIGSIILLSIGFILFRRMDFKGLINLALIIAIALAVFFSFFCFSEKNSIDKTNKTSLERQYQYEMKKKLKNVGSDIKTLNYRTETWKKTIPAIKERPFFGYGTGTFEYAYRKHYDGDFYTKYAHNILLKTWVELGLFGLLSFVLFVIGIFLNLRRENNDLHNFIFISCMAGLLFALSNVTFEAPAYLITFFILSSIFFVSKGNNNKKNVFSLLDRALILPLCIIMVILCGSFYFTAKSDTSKKAVEDGKILEDNGFWTDAFRLYKDAIEEMPLNNDGYISAINILINSLKNERNIEIKEKIKGGIAYYLKKVEGYTDKNSELFFIMGMAYGAIGDIHKAGEYFKQALHFYPSSGYYAYKIAQFYYLSGDLVKTQQMLDYITTYADRYKKSGNLNGIYVYMARDLKADIAFREGKKDLAFMIAQENLDDAEKGAYVISDPRAREYVNRDIFINYLKNKANFYRSRL